MRNFFSAPENASLTPPLDSGQASTTTIETYPAAPSSIQKLTPPNPSDVEGISAESYLTKIHRDTIPCQSIRSRFAQHQSFLRLALVLGYPSSPPHLEHPDRQSNFSTSLRLSPSHSQFEHFRQCHPLCSSRHEEVFFCARKRFIDATTRLRSGKYHHHRNLLSCSISTSATNTSSSVRYTVFISHAGEDKYTIAIPLREKLRAKGITAFVDEADMPCGTDAVQAMTLAMKTAKVGVIILSPEFIAKKWPMRELMHFLKRREECSGEGRRDPEAPTIIPFFYRLSIADLYNEPKLDRKDQDGNLLYEKTRFFERQKNGEAEADVEKVKAALKKLHAIMGVPNSVEASNDSRPEFSKRREILLDYFCNKICDSVPEDKTRERNLGLSEAGSFRPWFPPKLTDERAVLDFDSPNLEGRPSTPEGLVKQYLLEENSGAAGIVSLYGLGGVGKSTIVQVLMNEDDTRGHFTDGVHLIKLGKDATSDTLFRRICYILEISGAEKQVQSLRERNDVEEVVEFFLTWFEGKKCVFFIDDVWEHRVNVPTLSRLCDVASINGGNRVLITTREYEIAFTQNARPVRLDPRESRGEVARKILLFHADKENDYVMTDAADAIPETLDICAGLPVSLAVAGKSVRKMGLVGKRPVDGKSVWARYLSRLRTSRQTLLRQNVGSYGSLYLTFVASLNFLDEKSPEEMLGFRTKFTFSEMHRRLCVLQKQAVVPNTMLMHLWGTESEEDADSIAMQFVEVGLGGHETAQNESECESGFSLHDSVHDFAVWEAGRNGDIVDAHSLLLEGYGSEHEEVTPESEDKKVRWWSRGLKDDAYIHKQLCRHLAEGGRKKELCELLLTPLWVKRQIEVNGIVCLEDDFDMWMKEVGEGEETKEALRLIANAVRLSSVHVLENITELWFQLHGRLHECGKGNGVIEKYVTWMETDESKPRVLSVNRILLGAGGRIRKIIPVGRNVECMALSRDEERIACGCSDGSVVVMNIRRSKIERRWKAHEGENETVSSIALAQNGTRIVTLSSTNGNKSNEKGRLDIWDLESGKHVRRIGGDFDEFECFAISHDETCVVSASRDGSLQWWDLRSGMVGTPVIKGERRVKLYRRSSVRTILLLGSGERAIILYWNGKLKFWNIRTGVEIGEFDDDTDKMFCVTVTPDKRRVVSGSHNGKVILWDLESRQRIWSSRSGSTIECVAVSKDGSRIASGDGKGAIQIWNVESGDQVCDPLRGHFRFLSGVSFLGSKDSIVSSSLRDVTVRVWDIIRGTKEKSFDGHERRVTGVSFTPDGKSVVTSGSFDCSLRIWDTASGQMLGDPLCGHSRLVNDVAVTPDGRFVVSVSRDKTVRVWDLESRNLLCTLKGHTYDVLCVAVTPKGDRAVTASWDKTVRVWDLAKMDGSHVVLEGHKSDVQRVFVSDDGLRIVSVDWEHNVFLWSMETQDVLKTAVVDGAQRMSRREVFNFIGEDTVDDDAGLFIRRWSNQIIHGKGSEARVLATLESGVYVWDISPDKKTICLGLGNGQVALLKVDV